MLFARKMPSHKEDFVEFFNRIVRCWWLWSDDDAFSFTPLSLLSVCRAILLPVTLRIEQIFAELKNQWSKHSLHKACIHIYPTVASLFNSITLTLCLSSILCCVWMYSKASYACAWRRIGSEKWMHYVSPGTFMNFECTDYRFCNANNFSERSWIKTWDLNFDWLKWRSSVT